MRIIIVTPGSRASRHDGRQPALRWATHLRALGHAVDTDSHWESGAHDLMIVEEVRHGRDAVHAWRRANPRGPLVLMLRGGDEYREIEADAALRDVLGLASRLVPWRFSIRNIPFESCRSVAQPMPGWTPKPASG